MDLRQPKGYRMFVAERNGLIVSFDARKQDASEKSEFLHLSVNTEGEHGLLGFDFHPDYPSKPYVFVYYSVADSVSCIPLVSSV